MAYFIENGDGELYSRTHGLVDDLDFAAMFSTVQEAEDAIVEAEQTLYGDWRVLEDL